MLDKLAGNIFAGSPMKMIFSRLCLIGILFFVPGILFAQTPKVEASNAPFREVHLLEENSLSSLGTTWGVPWPQGSIPVTATFALKTADGKPVPMQTWPLAYWPDGSLKWTAHAISATAELKGPLKLEPGTVTAPAKPLAVTEDATGITVDTGVIQCHILKSGATLIDSVAREGKIVATNGQLVCKLRTSSDPEDDGRVDQSSYISQISSASVEQNGPVRAVIKIEGQHKDEKRSWLPFIVRLYFYAGSDGIRMIHTIIYDGKEERDFISGLGVRFSVPLKDELYDRHIRFAGEDGGVWGEAVRGLTGLQVDPGLAVRQAQIAGLKTPPLESWAPLVSSHLDYIPAFGDFNLTQLSSNSFEIQKRTKAGFTWLASATGHRAPGLGYIGGPSGGLAFGIRNFWQSYPSELSIRHADTDTAEVTTWLWSPEAKPMDMRFYHDVMGMDTFDKQNEAALVTYEDYEPGYSSAQGVARTSELMFWALPATPSNEQMTSLAKTLSTPPQMVCRPQDYKDAQVFGGAIWSLPDRANPVAVQIEDQQNFLLNYFEKQAEQRNWYGFWYYGNMMNRYDLDRHVWRYDVGGYAWDNSEPATDLWFWYSFLRTGRPDLFRFAEAMTRYSGEVPVYHLGRFAGLGSRHNVVPWGDSSKQLRVSSVENRRFFYYLTADERVGDLMREELTADKKAGEIPVERKVMKDLSEANGKPYPMNLLIGIEWTSMASAWLTEWERTGDTKYRDKIITGMKGIAALPHGWFSGGGGYNPETGQFFKRDDGYYISHLSAIFGGFEVNAELLQLLDVPEYEKTWLEYCKYYNAGPKEQIKYFGKDLSPYYLGVFMTQNHSRLTAYAAWKMKDHELAKRAWSEFLSAEPNGIPVLPGPLLTLKHVGGSSVLQPVDEYDVSTNSAVGFGLSSIDCLSLIEQDIPRAIPPAPDSKESKH